MAKKKEPQKKEPLAVVMLKYGATATFRRNMRDAKGNVVKKLEFPPGTPVELHSKAEVEAVYNDIGKALSIVQISDLGQAHVDFDATAEVVKERDGEDIAEQLEETTEQAGDQSETTDTTESAAS